MGATKPDIHLRLGSHAEKEYFEVLVLANHAKSPAERSAFGSAFSPRPISIA